MNERINKFLIVGDKFMPEMHLKQPGFIYSPCAPFTTSKGRIENFMQTGDTEYIYKILKILIKLVLNMIWLMVNIKISIKETNQIKF